MSVDFPPGLVLESMVREGKREAVEEGIKALVWLYYDEMTDATELEPDDLRAIQHFADLAGVDASELVVEAETEINAAGGMRSDTTGERHTVRTAHLYEDDDEDVRGCSCGEADYGAPGHDGGDDPHIIDRD